MFRTSSITGSIPALLVLLLSLFVPGSPCCSMPLDDAISMAKDNLPSFKAAKIKLSSEEALYDASLGPYFPSLDGATTQEKHDTNLGEYDLSAYDLSLSYTLFDGGRRHANRNIARLNRDNSREEVTRSLLELEFAVKSAFYAAMARKEILEHRKVQLQDAEKDYEIAQGRNRFGVAKLSDVLQASVRFEQARFTLTRAEGELKNAVADLNSLLGRPLESPYDLEGSLDFQFTVPSIERLSELTLKRPEIRQAENSVGISKYNKSLETSAFFPDVSAVASYSRQEGGLSSFSSDDDRSIGIRATWNIFELGKFYRRKSAQFDINVSRENLQESIRQVLLELRKAYNDFITTSENIGVAQEQLKQAEQNYSQAFGEYRVGKGDILSLVQAESSLALVRVQYTTARLDLMLSKALLERASGIQKLESVAP
ncbi:MAG: TolC family protein [Deltaproteobacteria bacterium]|nr:TolC family protein [Deltaproteobacteria bacterium]